MFRTQAPRRKYSVALTGPGNACVRSGKRVGIDYVSALERAIRGQSGGLAELFRYTVVGEMDGAAGEAHAAVLFGLLERWGDKRFADVLRGQKRTVRKAVIETLPMLDRRKFPLTAGVGGR